MKPRDAGTRDRRLSVDLLKIAMAICVIAIHANPLQALPEHGTFLTGGLARVAVPVFFLVNGYFFEPVARSGGTRTYALRLLWLFAIWSVLYLPAWSWALSRPDPWPLIRFTVMGWWHLWYLAGLALAAVLAAWVRGWSLRWQLGTMGASFLAGVAIVYGMAFGGFHPPALIFGDMTVLHRNGLFLGLPFVLAGMLIRRYALEDRFSLPALTVVVVVSLGLVVGEGRFLDHAATGLANHDNLLTLGLASPALFLLALKFPYQSSSRTFGTYANGLFFVHVAFCVIGFRLTELPHFWIFCLSVAGSLLVTWVMIHGGLARKLL